MAFLLGRGFSGLRLALGTVAGRAPCGWYTGMEDSPSRTLLLMGSFPSTPGSGRFGKLR